MKKSILEKFISFTLSMGFLAGVCILDGMSWAVLADNLTFLFIAIVAYVLLDDFIAKVIWYRFAITKRYLVYEGLYIASLVAFTGAFLCHSFGLGVGLLVTAFVVFAVAFALHVIFYRDKAYTSFEVDRAKWVIMREAIDNMSEEEVRTACYSFLRFYPKRGFIKANLSLRDPIDTKHRNWTLAEIMDKEEDKEYVAEVKAKLDGVIDDYLLIRPEHEEAKEEKEAEE